jgi:hypothetical protein
MSRSRKNVAVAVPLGHISNKKRHDTKGTNIVKLAWEKETQS